MNSIDQSWITIQEAFNQNIINEEEYFEFFHKYEDIKKAWSVDLLHQNPGSRWVTMTGHKVLVKGGRVIAGNPHVMEFVNGKAEANDKSTEIPVGASFGENNLGLNVSRYSDKAILIGGNTYANLDTLREIKNKIGAGTFNKKLNGWVFPFTAKDTVLGILASKMTDKSTGDGSVDQAIKNVTDLKNSVEEGKKVIVDGKPGTITGKDVDETGLNYHVKTDDGKDVNDVKEKDLEILPTTDQKEAEDAINSATPENRNKVAKTLFGKEKEEEPTEKQKEKEEKSNEEKRKLIKKTSFTTPTGLNLKNVEDYTGVIHSDILLSDPENILETERPYYIPEIDEDRFDGNYKSLHFIKIEDDKYLLANDTYRIPVSISRDEKAIDEHIKNERYSLVTTEVLLATQEYYRDKAKAVLAKKNKEDYERAMESFNKLSKEDRKRYREPKQKRTVLSKVLKGDEITGAYFRMYQKFRNGSYILPKGRYTREDEAAMDFNEVRKVLNYKKNDMDRQKEDHGNTFKKGQETSYGDTNLNDGLLDSHGVKIKMQNGKDVDAGAALEIKKALSHVYDTFGDRSSMAKNFGLKISHSGDKKMHASKAIGIYVPHYKTIGVSSHYGEHKFGLTLGHEFAHFMDNYVGKKKGRYFASDDYSSTAGKIANEFRNNMNQESDSGYINRTCECFARALEQYQAFKVHGTDAEKIGTKYKDDPNHVSASTFNEKIKPLIEQFLQENDHLLKSISFSFDSF